MFRIQLVIVVIFCMSFETVAQTENDTIFIDSSEISPQLERMFDQVLGVKQNDSLQSDSITEEKRAEIENRIEIDGLVIDNTKTKAGRDFYTHFYSNWNPPGKASDYTLFIEEKPGIRQMTFIEVRINENLIFRSNLQPRADVVKSMAKNAVNRAVGFLANYEEIKKQMGSEDMQGTGIY